MPRTHSLKITLLSFCIWGIALAAGLGSSAYAETVIGINFNGRNNSGNANVPLLAGDTAGVVPRANWNNESGQGTTTAAVNKQDGTSSGASVTWMSSDSWNTNLTQDGSGNAKMMLGYLDSQGNGGNNSLTLTVSSLPASFGTAPYNVYVYSGNDTGGTLQDTDFTLNDGTHNYVIRGTVLAQPSFSGGKFVKANGNGGNSPAGNYWYFTNVQGTSFTLSGTLQNGATRAGITGIQVVQPDVTSTPIAINSAGYTADVVLENTGTPSATQFGAGDNSTFFEARSPNPADGLPQGGKFISETDLTTIYQFQSYAANNCLLLASGASATLTFSTNSSYSKICVLAASSGATATTQGSVVINYADGSHSASIPINTFDWASGTTNIALSSLGRSSTNGTTFTYQRSTGFNLYETQISNPSVAKAIQSLTFTAANTITGSTGIFAVSGIFIPNNFIASVTPNTGSPAGGTTGIVIAGTGIQSGATVTFGTQLATVTNINTTNQTITVTSPASTPAGAYGPVNVTYTNPDTTAATLVNGFTYTTGVAPTVSSLSPTTGAFTASTPVSINGTGFAPNIASVIFNDGAGHTFTAAVTFVSSSQLTTTIPPLPAAFTSDVLNVTVTNPDSLSGVGSGVFSYISLPVFTPFTAYTVGTGSGTATTQVDYVNGTATLAADPKQGTGAQVSAPTIYYTIDGSTPMFPVSGTTTLYNGPIPITGTLALPEVVNAITVVNGTAGPVQTATYVQFLPAAATPVTNITTGTLNVAYFTGGTGLVPQPWTLPTPTLTTVTTAITPDILTKYPGSATHRRRVRRR